MDSRVIRVPTGLCDNTKYKLNAGKYNNIDMSLVMRRPAFCTCENKDADQLRGNREADQRICFRYTGSTIPVLRESEIYSL